MRLTAAQHFELSHRRISDRNNTFVEIMQGPNPSSPEEIDRLIAIGKGRYDVFACFGASALKRAGMPVPTIKETEFGWEIGVYRPDYEPLVIVDDELTARQLAFGWLP